MLSPRRFLAAGLIAAASLVLVPAAQAGGKDEPLDDDIAGLVHLYMAAQRLNEIMSDRHARQTGALVEDECTIEAKKTSTGGTGNLECSPGGGYREQRWSMTVGFSPADQREFFFLSGTGSNLDGTYSFSGSGTCQEAPSALAPNQGFCKLDLGMLVPGTGGGTRWGERDGYSNPGRLKGNDLMENHGVSLNMTAPGGLLSKTQYSLHVNRKRFETGIRILDEGIYPNSGAISRHELIGESLDGIDFDAIIKSAVLR